MYFGSWYAEKHVVKGEEQAILIIITTSIVISLTFKKLLIHKKLTKECRCWYMIVIVL